MSASSTTAKPTSATSTTMLYFSQSDWKCHDRPRKGHKVKLRPLEELRVATWNVWNSKDNTKTRYPYIIQTLMDHKPPLDIIALQEVTAPLFEVLLSNPTVRTHWLVTDLKEQFEITTNWYSTVILVRKGLFDFVESKWMEFSNTRTGRGLNMVVLWRRGKPCLRVGTSHFESLWQDRRKRKAQYIWSMDTLQKRGHRPSILLGDFNPTSYDALQPVLSRYKDAFLTASPLEDSQDPFLHHATVGVTLGDPAPAVNNKRKGSPPRRLDYIFTDELETAVITWEFGYRSNSHRIDS